MIKPYSKYMQQVKLQLVKEGNPLLRENIKSSADIFPILKKIHSQNGNDIQEHFYVLLLNRNNKVVGYHLASIGGMTGTVADPKVIISSALLCGAVCIILCHNHPSGSLKPSRADEQLTLKLKEAANLFDITVLDHLIITDSGYYSFADEGIL